MFSSLFLNIMKMAFIDPYETLNSEMFFTYCISVIVLFFTDANFFQLLIDLIAVSM